MNFKISAAGFSVDFGLVNAVGYLFYSLYCLVGTLDSDIGTG